MAEAARDGNFVTSMLFESASTSGLTIKAKGDETTGRLYVDMAGGGSGTVTDVSVVTANGISGSVATSTTTPAITLTLGSITPSAVQISGLTASEIVGTDASKNLVSLAIATYPSLTELSYVKGVTSALQTQINAKAPSTSPTFATSITGSYLTASEMVITDGSKNIVSAPVATYPSLTELTYLKGVTSAIQTQFTGKAATNQTMYIGTTAVTIDRASAALTLAGLTLTTPDIGTPSAGVLTNATGLPVSGITPSTVTALGVGSLELGHATDTTISRVSAGVVAVEGVVIPSVSSADTLSNKTLTAPKFVDAGFIADANGNEQVVFQTTASAVNEFEMTNAATGTAPILAVTGGDANIDMKLAPKGTGKVVPTAGVNHGAFTAYFTETDNGNSGTADTIDWGLSNKQKSTLTGNCTFTFTAPAGPCSLILKLVQDATGSRTVVWPATVHWPGDTAPTLTTTSNKVDIISFYWDGTTYFGNSTLNFTA